MAWQACPKKAKQLTLLDYQSKKLKMTEAEDHESEMSESHSNIELEDESLDEQDFSETERDSFSLLVVCSKITK